MNQSSRTTRKRRLFVWTTAILGPVAATLVRMALTPVLGSFAVPFITFFPTVMFVAASCGFRAATVTILLSALAASYYFIPPEGSFLTFDLGDAIGLLVFVSISFGIALFSYSRRQALVRADREVGLRRDAERAERAQRERLATTLASVGDAVISTDAAGRIVFANPIAQSLLRWPEPEMLGKHLDEVFRIINEDSRAAVESPVAKVLREGTVVGLANHTVLIARDGTEIPIDDSGAPIRGPNGTIQGTVLVFRDVTTRRRAEEESHLLASIVQSSNDAIISKDLNGIITSWNDAARDIFEYSAEEAIGEPIMLIAAPGHLDEMPEILERIKRGERIDNFETVRRTKSGQLVSVSLTISPIRDATGRIVGASKIARDITERLRTAQRLAALNVELAQSNANLARANDDLQNARDLLKATLAGIGDAVISTDTEGRIVFANHVAHSLLRWPDAELLGKQLDDVFRAIHEQTRERVKSPARSVLREGAIVALANHTLIARDGAEIPIDDSIAPIRGEDGNIQGAVLVFRDITERKHVEEERTRLLMREQAARTEAERANRLKDEFLATVSHELRTPLAAVLGWAELLQVADLDEPSRDRALKAIGHNAKMQAKLLEDILDVSRVVSGKLLLEMQRVELRTVIEGALESIRPAAEAKEIRLRDVIDPQAGSVEGDPERLEQIMRNVLSNAVKFSHEGGHVEVRLERRGPHVEICVKDWGEGIPVEFLPHVFEPFRQADASASRRHGGLGLGLAIVRHVVDLHGGAIQAHSDGPGTGATFIIRLPLLGGKPEHGSERFDAVAKATATLSGMRILVVEDNMDTRELLTVVLREYGAEVHVTASAQEAFESFRLIKPDALVCDIGLPGEDGYGLLRRIRALKAEGGSDVPALALTAYTRSDDRQQALAAGFQMHLAKPVEPIMLARTLGDLVRGRSAAGEPENEQERDFRIVVVDDAKDVADVLAMVLRDLGHEVHVFYDCRAALSQIRDIRPDIVFSDISMREMDGYEFVERLRAWPELGSVILVAITGFNEDEVGGQTLRAGFDYHLVKPVSVSQLKEFFGKLTAGTVEP